MDSELLGEKNQDIKVSIAMLAYNHEQYIERAIESVLMQKINFKIEIVIAEDCSTDKTRQFALKYKREYLDLIVLKFQKVNVGMNKNFCNLLNACKGKYIAFLECDDYWMDEYKLQKQVDFLEKNTDYSAVYHNIDTVDKHNKKTKNEFPYRKTHTLDSKKSIQELLLVGQTGSLMCVNFWNKWSMKERKNFYHCKAICDRKLCLELLFQGKVFFMSDIMSAHRKVTQGGDSWTARMAKKYGKNLNKVMYLNHKSLIKYAYMTREIEVDISTLKKVVESSIVLVFENPTKINMTIAMECLLDYLMFIFKRSFDKVNGLIRNT